MSKPAVPRLLVSGLETDLGQTFDKAGIVGLPPHGEHTAGLEGRPGRLQGHASVERVIAFVAVHVGAGIQVQDDGIQLCRRIMGGKAAYGKFYVAVIHLDPCI